LIAQGEEAELNLDEIKPAYDDIYTFSYTSGTTGPPKGVLLSHGNMLACMATFAGHPDFKISSDDHYLSYLPLPHVMERVVSLFAFYQGVSL
jgi:long-chain acyl-CoA synthetase